MPKWRPDWQTLVSQAQEIDLEARPGNVYVVADAHLGDSRATPEAFLEMLDGLPDPGAMIFLGDLFKVWLALPRFANDSARAVLAGFARLRARGAQLIFVVGNREYLVPVDARKAQALGLPFDHVVPGFAFLRWQGRRYGLTHGDLVNRDDRQYLRWRRLSRGRSVAALFRAMPPPLARLLAERLEHSLARTNQEIKISYPETEVRAFAEIVGPLCDLFLIGHFHQDREIRPSAGGTLRIVPDWFSQRVVAQLKPTGGMTLLHF